MSPDPEGGRHNEEYQIGTESKTIQITEAVKELKVKHKQQLTSSVTSLAKGVNSKATVDLFNDP